METKPYNLQSPEQIAKDYGGNKQKIAEAMQMGILDPTAGTLAAMFIDRMRSAAQTEAAPQQSVAQQVFAPPAPQAPAGLGAVPPMNATPPMDAVPAGLGATPEAAMMAAPETAPMGMAAGGYVPPYASGGLDGLPLPDGMFDEPSNGGFNDGYRGGGLVAFAQGDEVFGFEEEEEEEYPMTGSRIMEDGTILAIGQKKRNAKRAPDFAVPTAISGYSSTLLDNLDAYGEAAPRETKRAAEYAKYLESMLSPEERKARRKEDMWMALGQIGAKMASTPGSLFQAASAGMAEALPGIAAAAKERRAEQRNAMQALVAEERAGNKEITERADKALDMLAKYGTLADAMKERAFRNLWENMASADRRYVAQVNAAAGIRQQQISSGTQFRVGQLGYNERRGAIAQDLAANFDKNAMLDQTYQDLLATDPAKAAKYRDNTILGTLNRIMPELGGNNPLGLPGR